MPWERRAFYANGSDTRIGFSLERGRRRLPLLDHDVEGDERALDAAAVDAVLDGFLRDVVGDAVRAQHLEPLGQVEAAGRIRRHALEADLAFLADDDNAELAVVELVERVVLKKSLREALGREARKALHEDDGRLSRQTQGIGHEVGRGDGRDRDELLARAARPAVKPRNDVEGIPVAGALVRPEPSRLLMTPSSSSPPRRADAFHPATSCKSTPNFHVVHDSGRLRRPCCLSASRSQEALRASRRMILSKPARAFGYASNRLGAHRPRNPF